MDPHRVIVTIKNYASQKGLSSLIHDDILNKEHLFEVKGPMGKGLQINSTGTHVAYAAGTGVLVFIDLIAHLILCLIAEYGDHNILDKATRKVNINDFKLVLYTSFTDKEEAICLPLIEGLTSLCEKYKRTDIFEHYPRISRDAKGAGRWNDRFFFDQFKRYL
jgi:NAD(P)H-flavin reductase